MRTYYIHGNLNLSHASLHLKVTLYQKPPKRYTLFACYNANTQQHLLKILASKINDLLNEMTTLLPPFTEPISKTIPKKTYYIYVKPNLVKKGVHIKASLSTTPPYKGYDLDYALQANSLEEALNIAKAKYNRDHRDKDTVQYRRNHGHSPYMLLNDGTIIDLRTQPNNSEKQLFALIKAADHSTRLHANTQIKTPIQKPVVKSF